MAPLSTRPCTAADEQAVLALVNADRSPGRHATGASALADAVRGWTPSGTPADAPGRGDLAAPCTDVLVDAAGAVRGVVSCTTRRSDGAGLLLWLHCHEDDRLLADQAIAHVLARLPERPVHAFAVATPLVPGLEGLPVAGRPGTRAALLSAGFAEHERGSVLQLPVPQDLRTGEPRIYPLADVAPRTEPDGWELRLRETDGSLLGHAALSRPVHGCGRVLWIGVEPPFRRKGLGRTLLDQSVRLLAAHGAEEVAACLYRGPGPDGAGEDDEAAEAARAAEGLLAAAGFQRVDRLLSFTYRPGPEKARPHARQGARLPAPYAAVRAGAERVVGARREPRAPVLVRVTGSGASECRARARR